MMLATAWGQRLDLMNPGDETSYWAVVQAKSAPCFGAALESGAWLGGADRETALALRALGEAYGEMIQIHDDLQDVMATPAQTG